MKRYKILEGATTWVSEALDALEQETIGLTVHGMTSVIDASGGVWVAVTVSYQEEEEQ